MGAQVILTRLHVSSPSMPRPCVRYSRPGFSQTISPSLNTTTVRPATAASRRTHESRGRYGDAPATRCHRCPCILAESLRFGQAFHTRAMTMPEPLGPFRAGPGGLPPYLAGRGSVQAALPGVRRRRGRSCSMDRAATARRRCSSGWRRKPPQTPGWTCSASRPRRFAPKRCSSSACFRCRGGSASRRKGPPSTESPGGRARAAHHRRTWRVPLSERRGSSDAWIQPEM